MPNGTEHSCCTDPTQATAGLVIILVITTQKSGTGDNDSIKWKETFRSDRPKFADFECADRSKWTTFKGGPKYSGQTETKWSVPFDF